MSFFKDFKDDLSQAVNELMPEESTPVAPVATPVAPEPQMVDTISQAEPSFGQDDIADLLKNIDVPASEPMFEAAEPVAPVTPVPVETAPVAEPVVVEPVAEVPVPETPVEIPVYTEAPVHEPVAPVFAPEPEKVEVPHEPVAPVFAPEPEKVEAPHEPVAPVFAPEPEKVEEPKAPVTPVFAETTNTYSAPINTIAEGVNETGVIPMGMTVTGNIVSNGSLDIMGTVKGDVTVAGKLNITGNIEGNSKAEEVFADGARIIGEIVSNGTIKVGQSSVIKGNLSAQSAVLAGAVKGDIDVKGPVILDSTAIIMGNIKSKSIQINNGAAIEGLCSQCYAEVNPASFFTEG